MGGVGLDDASANVLPASAQVVGECRGAEIETNYAPEVLQQGTLSSQSISYWMGSIAQDKNGDIALGFSASSPTLDPSIAYTGRMPADPPGKMESLKYIIRGTGVQLNTGLWGAYSSMTIDPVDDCTFWYATEYIKTTGSLTWRTRIASFRFQSCT